MTAPKKRLTKRRRNNRRSQGHQKVVPQNVGIDTTTGTVTMPHRMRLDTGVYKGKKIVARLSK